MPETIYLASLGHMAVMAQLPVARVQAILAELGAQPMFVIDGVPHYLNADLGAVLKIVFPELRS